VGREPFIDRARRSSFQTISVSPLRANSRASFHRVISAVTSGDVIRGMPSGLAVTTAVRRSQRITLLHRLTLAEHAYADQNGRHGADHPTSTIATRQPEQQREHRGTGQRTDLAE